MYDALSARNPRRKTGRPLTLSDEEEERIVLTVLYYADCGVPLTRLHLLEAITIFVEKLPPKRRIQLPFRDGKPGTWFVRSFQRRHHAKLKFAIPKCHEGKRHANVNAETITTHFATFEKLLDKYNIDSNRLWNLDETGGIPGRDANGNSKRKRYCVETPHKTCIYLSLCASQEQPSCRY